MFVMWHFVDENVRYVALRQFIQSLRNVRYVALRQFIRS
jgi:hypothetical protein